MHGTSVFSCMMAMISNVTIFFYFSNIFIQLFFCVNVTAFCIFILIIFIACSLKDSQNLFINLYPYIHHAYFLYYNDDIVDIEKPNGICSPTFVVNEFSALFLHPSFFLLKIQDLQR